VSGLIRQLSFLQSHVFLLNSRLGLFAAASPSLEEAPLLPKLQGYFAEFLSRDSLEHLSLLDSTTCVGLRYGSSNNCLRYFSWKLLGVIIPAAEALGYYQGHKPLQRTIPSVRRLYLTPS
jgi:hypothetical protein